MNEIYLQQTVIYLNLQNFGGGGRVQDNKNQVF